MTIRVLLVAFSCLLVAGKAKPTATPPPTPSFSHRVGRMMESVPYEGPDDAARAVVKQAFVDSGFEVESDSRYVITKWRMTETVTTIPRAARRSQYDANCRDRTCLLILRVEATSQYDAGGERWVWDEWGSTSITLADEKEFERVRALLLERLPKPDPKAPPPGSEKAAEQGVIDVDLQPGVPLDVSKYGIEPVAIYAPKPPYPLVARDAGRSGTVVVEIIVDPTGIVTSARLVKGHPQFASAVDTVKKWRYQPVLVNGVAVESKTEVSLAFGLR